MWTFALPSRLMPINIRPRQTGVEGLKHMGDELWTPCETFDADGVPFEDWLELRRMLVAHNSLECRSEEHTSELQSLMRISYAVFCLKKKIQHKKQNMNYTI